MRSGMSVEAFLDGLIPSYDRSVLSSLHREGIHHVADLILCDKQDLETLGFNMMQRNRILYYRETQLLHQEKAHTAERAAYETPKQLPPPPVQALATPTPGRKVGTPSPVVSTAVPKPILRRSDSPRHPSPRVRVVAPTDPESLTSDDCTSDRDGSHPENRRYSPCTSPGSSLRGLTPRMPNRGSTLRGGSPQGPTTPRTTSRPLVSWRDTPSRSSLSDASDTPAYRPRGRRASLPGAGSWTPDSRADPRRSQTPPSSAGGGSATPRKQPVAVRVGTRAQDKRPERKRWEPRVFDRRHSATFKPIATTTLHHTTAVPARSTRGAKPTVKEVASEMANLVPSPVKLMEDVQRAADLALGDDPDEIATPCPPSSEGLNASVLSSPTRDVISPVPTTPESTCSSTVHLTSSPDETKEFMDLEQAIESQQQRYRGRVHNDSLVSFTTLVSPTFRDLLSPRGPTLCNSP